MPEAILPASLRISRLWTPGALLLFSLCLCQPLSLRAADPVMLDGVVKPFRSVTISASIREIIRKIHVEEGDRIKEGQALVSLQSEKQVLAVQRYEQLLSKAQFDFSAAQRLFEQKVASKDDALAKEVELKRLQAEMNIAKADLAEREIMAPLTGVVVRKFKESGESIAENDPILQVMETDQLLLLFYLEASQLPNITLGQKFAVKFPEMPAVTGLEGTVHFIDPEVDARSGLFRVRLLLDNKDGTVRPGLRVQAGFPSAPVKVSPPRS